MQHVRTSGFTVVEVFMVVTLLAIVVGLMVVPLHNLLESFNTRPLEQVVLSSVRKAHMQARQRNEPVVLSYLAASNRLELFTRDGIFIDEIQLERPANVGEENALLAFHRLLPENPKATEPAYEQEEEPVESIVFLPCGISTPFSVNLMDHRNEVRLILDPFSSEPVLRDDEEDRS